MVDIEHDLEIRRFPWSYSKVYNLIDPKDSNSGKAFIGFRVRLEIMLVTNPHDPFRFDAYHFTSMADMMDNAQLAKDCGLEVHFCHTHILVTPHSYSHIYKQIFEHDNICVSPQFI